MTTTEICRKTIDLGRVGQRTLQYFLTVENRSDGGSEYGAGIRIIETGEESVIRSLTTIRSAASDFLDLLATNFVTPTSLMDVAEDWLGQ